MNHRIQFTQTGGPEVLQWVEAPLANPGPGEVRVRHTAVGVNYIDVYQRCGAYPVPLPAPIGFEAAGVVEALGEGVTGLTVGQRVATADGPTGAYSEARNHPAARLVPLPDDVSDEVAAGLLFKGLTTHMLVKRVWPRQHGPWALVHAAAGGVGQILTRWLTREGAKVIGVVSSEAKAASVREAGAAAVLVVPHGGSYAEVAPEVKRITGGKGVGVSFDSVGKDSFEASLDSLAPYGLLASFGRSSGAPPLIDLADLGKRGSLAVQRPSFFHHVADPAVLRTAATEVFEAHRTGILPARVHACLPLRDAAKAHALLESRATLGSLVLVP